MSRNLGLRLYKNLVDFLSFSAPLRKMRRELNARIDTPESIELAPRSHPLGVNRWFTKRRISIAESYLLVVKDLDSRLSRSRLEALRTLAAVSLNPKSLNMPLNTARVQMALIKEVVKNRYNKRRQLELLHDFSVSTGAQRRVISTLCDELNIVELPEQGLRLAQMGFGWDDHVHDTATFGRKNPTQLVIDAFIKGISELSIAYGSISDVDNMEEALEAGEILGVRIKVGLEFSAYHRGDRFHFHALLPVVDTPSALREFFRVNETRLGAFFEGLEQNRLFRTEALHELLEEFNGRHLLALNKGFPEDAPYRMKPLDFKEFSNSFPTLSVNRIHLSEYLYNQYLPVLRNRYMLYKVLRADARARRKDGIIDGKECGRIEDRYSDLKKELKEISPEVLLGRYFDRPGIVDYKSVFDDIGMVSAMLGDSGCTLKLITPLEHGLEPALHVLDEYAGVIRCVEVYNTQDAMRDDPNEILALAHHLNGLNRMAAIEGKPPCIPVCGSDATGRNPKIPGMGFIFEDRIVGSRRKRYFGRHVVLPSFISALVKAGGKPVDDSETSVPSILSMGKIAGDSGYMKTSGSDDSAAGKPQAIPPAKAWRYFNPAFKETIYTGIGFVVAASFIGIPYAVLWLAITGFRNSIADLVASRGSRLSEWKLKSINFDNVAQSLFWTGFSVPILGFVKTNFDLVWPWAQDSTLFNLAKFFFISFANGLYLAAHNTLRGFEKKVVRANFFRSVIAWPFATAFAPLGNLLGVPSIVQAKLWSDFVAGFIEGGSKYAKILTLRRKNVQEILPLILSDETEKKYISILDLLYLFSEEPRTQTSLKAVFDPPRWLSVLVKPEGIADHPSTLHRICDTLEEETLGKGISDFILSRYDEEMAADLIDLVADTLPELIGWLGRMEKILAGRKRRQA